MSTLNKQTIGGVTLGDVYTDKVTKLKGVATAYAVHITGCDRVILQPTMVEEGKMPGSYWVDTSCLVDEDGNDAVPDPEPGEAAVKPGGPPSPA